MHTHTLADWLAMVSIAATGCAAFSAPYFLFVEADHWAWPRPLVSAVSAARPVVWDVTRSGSLYLLLREWDNARHSAGEFCRDAAALVLLLTTRPKGAMA
jgi:hypothetical protein